MTTILHFATTTPPITVDTLETRRPEASPTAWTRAPPIPEIVDTFQTRGPNASPKVTTFRDQDLPRSVRIVDTFKTRRPNASPKVRTILRLATPIREIVDTFETGTRNASPTAMTVLRFASIFGRGRLRTLADTRRTLCTDFASIPNPQSPNLKTRTLLLRIREQEDSEVLRHPSDLKTSGQETGVCR